MSNITLWVPVLTCDDHIEGLQAHLYTRTVDLLYLPRTGEFVELWEHGPTAEIQRVEWDATGEEIAVTVKGCLIDQAADMELERPELWNYGWRSDRDGDLLSSLDASGWRFDDDADPGPWFVQILAKARMTLT